MTTLFGAAVLQSIEDWITLSINATRTGDAPVDADQLVVGMTKCPPASLHWLTGLPLPPFAPLAPGGCQPSSVSAPSRKLKILEHAGRFG